MLSARLSIFIAAVLSAWGVLSALIGLWYITFLHPVLTVSRIQDISSDLKRLQDIDLLKSICIPIAESAQRQGAETYAVIAVAIWIVLAWTTVVAITSIYAYRQMSRIHDSNISQDYSFLEEAISGKLKLWKAFWVLLVLLPAGTVAIARGFFYLLTSQEILDPGSILVFAYSAMENGALWLVFILGSISVWRCSRNTERPLWTYLSRLAIGAALVPAIFNALVALRYVTK